MGGETEQFRKGIIEGGDPMRRHSLSQREMREMRQGQKRFYPSDKATRAETRRQRLVEEEQRRKEELMRSRSELFHLLGHMDVFGRVINKYITDKGSTVTITLVEGGNLPRNGSKKIY